VFVVLCAHFLFLEGTERWSNHDPHYEIKMQLLL